MSICGRSASGYMSGSRFAAKASNSRLNMRMISDDSLLTIVFFCSSHSAGTVAGPEYFGLARA